MHIPCPAPGCGFTPIEYNKSTSTAVTQIIVAHSHLHLSEICPIVQLSCLHPGCIFTTDIMKSNLAAVVMNDHYQELHMHQVTAPGTMSLTLTGRTTTPSGVQPQPEVVITAQVMPSTHDTATATVNGETTHHRSSTASPRSSRSSQKHVPSVEATRNFTGS